MSSPPVTDEVRAAAQALFEGHTRAWAESPEQGWEFQVSRNYPGYADADSAAAQELRSRMIEAGYWETFVPDVTSITPDPGWTPSADGLACMADFTSPPDGDTYIVTVDRAGGERSTDSLHQPQQAKVHVTMLDGTLYYYIPLCT